MINACLWRSVLFNDALIGFASDRALQPCSQSCSMWADYAGAVSPRSARRSAIFIASLTFCFYLELITVSQTGVQKYSRSKVSKPILSLLACTGGIGKCLKKFLFIVGFISNRKKKKNCQKILLSAAISWIKVNCVSSEHYIHIAAFII